MGISKGDVTRVTCVTISIIMLVSLSLRFGIYASRSGTRNFEPRILIRPGSPQ